MAGGPSYGSKFNYQTHVQENTRSIGSLNVTIFMYFIRERANNRRLK